MKRFQIADYASLLLVAMCATGALILLAVCVFALPENASGDGDGKTLQLLHIVMRHGARTPASTYPNDPYKNETFYPVGWGQLTNLYEIGRFLRNRYGKFLGTLYSPDIYYTQSTGVDRTKASMQMVNAGLWPPVGDQQWGPLDWQPVPIKSEPLDQDSLLLVRKPCPQYHIEKQKVMESNEVKSKMNDYRTLFSKMTEFTGMEINNFEDIQDVYTTLLAEIYLRNSTKVPPFQLTVPGCESSFCPLSKVKELTKVVIPINWDEECKTDDPDFVVPTLGGP
nr:unnamed protein product [Callosobruchus analis]